MSLYWAATCDSGILRREAGDAKACRLIAGVALRCRSTGIHPGSFRSRKKHRARLLERPGSLQLSQVCEAVS